MLASELRAFSKGGRDQYTIKLKLTSWFLTAGNFFKQSISKCGAAAWPCPTAISRARARGKLPDPKADASLSWRGDAVVSNQSRVGWPPRRVSRSQCEAGIPANRRAYSTTKKAKFASLCSRVRLCRKLKHQRRRLDSAIRHTILES